LKPSGSDISAAVQQPGRITEMQRRGFLGAILAAGAAPVFVGSSILMPVKRVWAPLTVAEITNLALLKLHQDMEAFSTQHLTRINIVCGSSRPISVRTLTCYMA
jgi:hypothetical protein